MSITRVIPIDPADQNRITIKIISASGNPNSGVQGEDGTVWFVGEVHECSEMNALALVRAGRAIRMQLPEPSRAVLAILRDGNPNAAKHRYESDNPGISSAEAASKIAELRGAAETSAPDVPRVQGPQRPEPPRRIPFFSR